MITTVIKYMEVTFNQICLFQLSRLLHALYMQRGFYALQKHPDYT